MDTSGFRTPVEPSPLPRLLQYGKPVITLGSCFADSIAARLQVCGFDVTGNPAGVIYQPMAIHDCLVRSLNGGVSEPDDFVEHQGIWYHYNFHSSVNAASRSELELKIGALHEQIRSVLQRADTIMVTYGTAWAFRRKENSKLVANCHKQPGHTFHRELLQADAMEKSFGQMLGMLRKINPQVQLILTVSPVRHLADTIEGNQLSKSLLRFVCHRLVTENSSVHYFPAYEIMMDDLRDYRFYARDMIHPSDVALDYIWDRFQASAFSLETRQVIARWEKVLQSLAHRPFHPESAAHLEFLKRLRDEVADFSRYFDVHDRLKLLDAQIMPQD